MVDVYIPLLLALIISTAYYFSNRHKIKNRKWNSRLFSFSAGVSITYVLLELFPTFTEEALRINKLLFISVLGGFIIHHIIEKEIYQHNKRYDLIRMLSFEENIFSFIYHIVIGIVLVNFAKFGATEVILFSIPMLSYTFLSNLPANPHKWRIKALFLSSATIMGAVLAILLRKIMPLWLEAVLMGLVVGVLLYTIIRHHIPFGRKGKIGYFTMGFLIYSMLIILSWYV